MTMFTAAQNAETPKQAEQIRHIEHRLMAPCCYSQTIDVHMSGEAAEMRDEVRSKVLSGKSEREIIDFYKARYGTVILATPDGITGIVAFSTPVFADVLALLLLLIFLWRSKLKMKAYRPAILDPKHSQPSGELLERIRRETQI